MSTKSKQSHRRKKRRKWSAINRFGRAAGPTHKSKGGRTGGVHEKKPKPKVAVKYAVAHADVVKVRKLGTINVPGWT